MSLGKIRTVCALIGGMLAVTATPSLAQDKQPARSKILVIPADDLGYVDIGFQGGQDIATPHLDGPARLAVTTVAHERRGRAAISRFRSAVYFHHGFFESPSINRTAAMNVSSTHGS